MDGIMYIGPVDRVNNVITVAFSSHAIVSAINIVVPNYWIKNPTQGEFRVEFTYRDAPVPF